MGDLDKLPGVPSWLGPYWVLLLGALIASVLLSIVLTRPVCALVLMAYRRSVRTGMRTDRERGAAAGPRGGARRGGPARRRHADHGQRDPGRTVACSHRPGSPAGAAGSGRLRGRRARVRRERGGRLPRGVRHGPRGVRRPVGPARLPRSGAAAVLARGPGGDRARDPGPAGAGGPVGGLPRRRRPARRDERCGAGHRAGLPARCPRGARPVRAGHRSALDARRRVVRRARARRARARHRHRVHAPAVPVVPAAVRPVRVDPGGGDRRATGAGRGCTAPS